MKNFIFWIIVVLGLISTISFVVNYCSLVIKHTANNYLQLKQNMIVKDKCLVIQSLRFCKSGPLILLPRLKYLKFLLKYICSNGFKTYLCRPFRGVA